MQYADTVYVNIEMTTTPLEPLDPLDLFSSDSVASLSDGFLNIFQPELLRVQDSLRELTVNQEEMLHSVHEKRTNLEEIAVADRIMNTLQMVPTYRNKAANLSKQMQSLTKRMKRLQQRAVKLKEGKVLREMHHKKELERRAQQERMLEAKPATAK